MFNVSLSPYDGRLVPLVIGAGDAAVTFELLPAESVDMVRAQRGVLLDSRGLSEEEIAALTLDEQQAWLGRTVAYHYVRGFTPFVVPQEDGTELTVAYDAPSPAPEYESMAEALLATDKFTRSEILAFVLNRANFHNLAERRVVGKSPARGASTEGSSDPGSPSTTSITPP